MMVVVDADGAPVPAGAVVVVTGSVKIGWVEIVVVGCELKVGAVDAIDECVLYRGVRALTVGIGIGDIFVKYVG